MEQRGLRRVDVVVVVGQAERLDDGDAEPGYEEREEDEHEAFECVLAVGLAVL